MVKISLFKIATNTDHLKHLCSPAVDKSRYTKLDGKGIFLFAVVCILTGGLASIIIVSTAFLKYRHLTEASSNDLQKKVSKVAPEILQASLRNTHEETIQESNQLNLIEKFLSDYSIEPQKFPLNGIIIFSEVCGNDNTLHIKEIPFNKIANQDQLHQLFRSNVEKSPFLKKGKLALRQDDAFNCQLIYQDIHGKIYIDNKATVDLNENHKICGEEFYYPSVVQLNEIHLQEVKLRNFLACTSISANKNKKRSKEDITALIVKAGFKFAPDQRNLPTISERIVNAFKISQYPFKGILSLSIRFDNGGGRPIPDKIVIKSFKVTTEEEWKTIVNNIVDDLPFKESEGHDLCACLLCQDSNSDYSVFYRNSLFFESENQIVHMEKIDKNTVSQYLANFEAKVKAQNRIFDEADFGIRLEVEEVQYSKQEIKVK